MAQVHTAEVRWDRDAEPSLPGDHPGEVDFDVQVFSMTGTRGRTRCLGEGADVLAELRSRV